MKFSIIIPTYNNFNYLQKTIESIHRNSTFDHQIIVHINGYDNESENFLIKHKILYTKSNINIGLCSGVNLGARKAKTDYILYAHDDMYFLPQWDYYLSKEVNDIGHKNFYLSLTQLSHTNAVKGDLQHIHFDCGSTLDSFDEKKLLENFNKFDFRNLQGSHWAPHLIHKSLWIKISGFSEEFNPGFASDPDLNMKLWMMGVRIFKGVSLSRVYHFGSLTTRKNNYIIPNKGKKTFLLKWKMTVNFFVKHYMRRGQTYNGPLNTPKKNIIFYIDFIISKLNYFLAHLR